MGCPFPLQDVKNVGKKTSRRYRSRSLSASSTDSYSSGKKMKGTLKTLEPLNENMFITTKEEEKRERKVCDLNSRFNNNEKEEVEGVLLSNRFSPLS